MSRLLVSQYQTKIEKLIQHGGSKNEASIRRAFENLLDEYCKTKNYELIAELEYPTKNGKLVKPDGTVKDAIRMAIGYWESKDQYDKLDDEIEKKFAKGYPNDNILFEDSQTAVLYQNGEEVLRVSMQDDAALDRLLTQFINYDRPEVRDFRAAIAKFKEDVPDILEALRSTIQAEDETNEPFRQKRDLFWEICKESINPEISAFDIQEMLIQHILTEDIFLNIFGESQFHQENNIASELQAVVKTFFKGTIKRDTLGRTKHFYAVIQRTAASIVNHHEKQKFLKVIYENFYKAYNPKAADRLGIVYTPNEIVRFMIESADYLTHKHFGKLLADPGVEILDPATGTGTFITELIEYLPANKLEYKYKNEIHCNEVAILPYYVANLNIELTYKQKMGKYEEFQNICFVDTLDHTSFEKKQMDLFAVSTENTERIKRQNDKTISVIIGNPPYNANQKNENDDNKNREYVAIDARIKETYIKHSKAQKTKLYDMYSRFFRWATDRLGSQGIIAFITNSSFIDTRNFDGFRNVLPREFNDIYIIDLGGNVRKNLKLSGTIHNIFGIQTGVAICFLVRKEDQADDKPCKIFYARQPEFDRAKQKIEFLSLNKIQQISFEHIQPDKSNNWINISSNDFEKLLALIERGVKSDSNVEKRLFGINITGVNTARDEWVYDLEKNNLDKKLIFLRDVYQSSLNKIKAKGNSKIISADFDPRIKWSEGLKIKLKRKVIAPGNSNVITALYRPFFNQRYQFSNFWSDRLTESHIQQFTFRNVVICFTNPGSEKPFITLASESLPDLHLSGAGCVTQCLPLYRYEKDGTRVDNITDWGLNQFRDHYKNPLIQPEDIFHYVYAVLHHPAYRTKYELNLKREFPRIPFYANFQQWADWGKQLMDLHINFEEAEPYALERIGEGMADESHLAMQASLFEDETTNGHSYSTKKAVPKCKLKADKIAGTIELDTVTTLKGIPAIAWEYKLGNRSALEWILDQYKEKKPKDPTIAKLFNTYCFADYKEHVIDLLQRVCTVSVKTMAIIQQMPNTVDHQG